eukprot:Lithocolla_globosa_v1_NODE_1950_length_2242_cov_281.407949.p3 type:complete len:123 gc:universal NODE_1950_length_2242_cov_281.407949:1486-1854(+)
MAVLGPVCMTTVRALPKTTVVPEKHRLTLSWMLTSFSFTSSVCLKVLTDSPVKTDCSTRKVVESMRNTRKSAGILSPTAISTMSPGTSSEDWIFSSCPLRMTLASSGVYSFKASMAFSALVS